MGSYMYPPIVENSASAFLMDRDFKLYFKYSSYSTNINYTVKSVHINILYGDTGISAIQKNKKNNTSFGYFITSSADIKVDENGLYYIIIPKDIIKDGWKKDGLYKFQIRFSNKTVAETNTQKDLSEFSRLGCFTEWSTYCSAKAISKPIIKIPLFDFESSKNEINSERIYSLATDLDLYAIYENEGNENLYSYRFQLYENNELLDDSNEIISDSLIGFNQMKYLVKYNLEENKFYKLKLTYITQNKYIETITLKFNVVVAIEEGTVLKIIVGEDTTSDMYSHHYEGTVSDAIKKYIQNSSIEQDNNEGRVSLVFYSTSTDNINQSFALRRSDSRTNYTVWEDIQIINVKETKALDLPVFYDYTVESGVYYKYVCQIINKNNYRSKIKDTNMSTIVRREFEYAFLLGENNQQLKIKYNNTMDNYTYSILEQKTDTIGSTYPFIYRNQDVKYRTFPLNGLISFSMDDNKVFTDFNKLYGSGLYDSSGKDKYDNVIETYTKAHNDIGQYDFKYEHDFREAVLAFLQDGKPKLFKSRSEGNILVYLMNVAAQPNNQLSRLIYSFTSTAYEVNKPNIANYKKYNLITLNDINDDYSVDTYKVGQFVYKNQKNTPPSELIELIFKKYTKGNNIITSIHNVSIEFLSKPYVIDNTYLGYSLASSKAGEVYINSMYGNVYEFDDNIVFSEGDSLYTSGDECEVIVNFIYKQSTYDININQIIKNIINTYKIGQYTQYCSPNTNIYNKIFLKYFNQTDNSLIKLSNLNNISIEAKPGATFIINSSDTNVGEEIIINQTGELFIEDIDITNIIYKGITEDGVLKEKSCDIIMNYIGIINKNIY